MGGLTLEEFLVYDGFIKEKKESAPETFETISHKDKFEDLWNERGAAKAYRDLINADATLKD